MRDAQGVAVDSMMEPPDGPAVVARQLAIRFTGSGSEYFRIWIVNLLLVLVTFTLYYPWAKARRLRYFHGNTLVDGTPLAFHGNPRTMFRGYLLVGVLFVLYSMAGQFSVTAGLLALVLVAAIAPALLRASMRFRLANTSWRGMRFVFSGSTGDAYRALLPLFVTAVLFVFAVHWAAQFGKVPVWLVSLMVGVSLLTVAMLPWLLWRLKRYQHVNYGLASLQTGFKATIGGFYALVFKTMAWSVLVVLTAIVAGIGLAWLSRGGSIDVLLQMTFMSMLPLLVVLCAYVVAKTSFTAGLQNLVWTKTGNRSMRFISQVRFSRLFLLTCKNWLLMLLTLGLYWPFAAVATTRMRLEAVSIKTRQNPASLVSLLQASDVDASGDAAGDLLDIDIGL
jgi:uncharacterized membrane protein YjgN (DUF898 family)